MPGKYLGVDIGTTSIKAVQVARGRQKPRLENYGFLETAGHLVRANKVLQTSSLKLFDAEAADILAALIRNMKPDTSDAVAAIPSFSAFVTVLDFPDMQEKELAQAITFEARRYVPLPLSEVALDWSKVGEYTDAQSYKHNQVLLISVPQEQIRKYQELFKRAGLRLRALEIESLALVRAAVGTDQTPTVVVDIGSHSTNIAIAHKGQLVYSGQTDYASAALTQSLSEGLNINPIRAEELKRERGITGGGANYELSTIMLPLLDVIIGEVKKVLFNYSGLFPQMPKPERVLLSGGGANLAGLERYASDQLGLPAARVAPLNKLEYPTEIMPLVPELNPILDVALGLALREF